MTRSKLFPVCRLSLVIAATAISLRTASAQAAKSASPSFSAHTVILPISEGPKMVLAVYPILPATEKMTFWAPKPAEVRRLEADMPKNLTDYYRQYMGASQGGKRIILINGFASSVAPEFVGGKYDWHKSTVSFMDGGRGFFQATYDPDTHQFVGPRFNGVG